MPKDYPDFGTQTTEEAYPLINDLGELAARLGSIATYDRRGNVVYLDDFEAPVLKWGISGDPFHTGWSGVLDSTSPRSGAQDLKLTTDAYSDNFVKALKQIQFRGSYRVGGEICFSLPSANSDWRLEVGVYTGTRVVDGWLKFDYTAGRLYYMNSAGTYVELASSITLVSTTFTHYNTKLVIDAETEKYVRLLFGNTEYDLSAISCRASDSVLGLRTFYNIYVYNQDATAVSTCFDDFIATINEP